MIFINPKFDSHKKVFDDITIDELFDTKHNDVSARIESRKGCLDRYLNPADKNPAIIRKIDREFSKQLDFKNIKFPVQKKRLWKN